MVSLPLGRVCGQERILKDSVDSLLSAEEVSDDWLEHLLEQDDERESSEFFLEVTWTKSARLLLM